MARSARWAVAMAVGWANLGAFPAAGAEPAEPAVQAATFNESPVELDEAARRAQTARQLARGEGGDPAALARVIQLTRGLSDAKAAAALDELALAHLRAGNLTLAADARRTLVAQFPQEPLAVQSTRWLVELYASSEIIHANRQTSAGQAALARQLASTTAQQVDGGGESGGGVAVAAYALHVANEAARANPALDDDPALRFQRHVAARRAGDARLANKFLTPLTRPGAAEPWGRCARAEAWLAARTEGESPKATLTCAVAATPPQLDGVLDEPMWHGEAVALLVEGRQSSPAPIPGGEVRLTHDDDFLYVAVRCVKLPGVRYEADARPRAHDGDVAQFDRVRLLVDLDRDYATWFELVVDSRGWTADRCGDDAAWNPQWYVAAGKSSDARGDCWTIETAIPFSALAEQPPAAGAAWACAIERMAPGAPGQTWCGKPGATGPERFGLLLFE